MLVLRKHLLFKRPAGDQGVYLDHEADGLFESYHNPLIVCQVVIAERSAFAVFEPLLAHLIAAYLEIPHLRGTPSKYWSLLI